MTQNKQEDIGKFISDQNGTVPCLYCPLNVFRSDMPRVGVCKICYAKALKEHSNKYGHLKTWDELLSTNSQQGDK